MKTARTYGLCGAFVANRVLLAANDLNLDIRTNNATLRFQVACGQVTSSNDLQEHFL